MLLARRLAATLFVAGLGLVTAHVFDIHGFNSSSGYFFLATVLLAIGLYSSAYEIEWKDVKQNVRTIFTAVTLGVLVKATLIAVAMCLAFQNDPTYIVLAVAVAQIDPLSVAVMRNLTPLSRRAKAILSAWSSFDDPVTAILAIYLSAVALNLKTENTTPHSEDLGTADGATMSNELASLGNGLLGNALLVGCAGIVWIFLLWVGKCKGYTISNATGPKSKCLQAVAILTLTVTAAVAVGNFWMLGLAAIGLFFRPNIDQFVSKATPIAFMLATFVLGVVLAEGINLLPGLVLGIAAFAAQAVVVTMLVDRSLPTNDRARLALGQQSGITAVILALILETMFPGTVAIVAPAIFVINALHLVSNMLFDKLERQSSRESHARADTDSAPSITTTPSVDSSTSETPLPEWSAASETARSVPADTSEVELTPAITNNTQDNVSTTSSAPTEPATVSENASDDCDLNQSGPLTHPQFSRDTSSASYGEIYARNKIARYNK